MLTVASRASDVKTPRELVSEVIIFSNKEILSVDDLPGLEQQLNNVLILDKTDNSRLAPEILMKSYLKNKSLYQQAFIKFNKSQRLILQEMFSDLENLNKNGNG